MTLPHMDAWVWLIVALVGAALLGALSGRLGMGTKSRLPYERRPALLTAGELAFFRVLQQSVGGELYVAPKVRLADLIAVRKGTEHFYTFFNKISSKHVDFVLCDVHNFAPVLVVELDDASHDRADAQDRDGFKDQALDAAHLPILRVKASRSYQVAQVRESVDQALHGPTVPSRRVG